MPFVHRDKLVERTKVQKFTTSVTLDSLLKVALYVKQSFGKICQAITHHEIQVVQIKCAAAIFGSLFAR